MIMMQSGTTINIFGNPNIIAKRQNLEMPMNLLTNAGSKTVEEVKEITGSGKQQPIWR